MAVARNRRWDRVPLWLIALEGDDETPITGLVRATLTGVVQRVDGRVLYPAGATVEVKLGDRETLPEVRALVRSTWRAADLAADRAAAAAAGEGFDEVAWDAAWGARWDVLMAGATFFAFPAVDDPDIVQTGWQVKIEERFPGGRTYVVEPRLADLDRVPPGVNLSAFVVPPGSPTAPAPVYAKGLPGGVASLDKDGLVPRAQLPAGLGSTDSSGVSSQDGASAYQLAQQQGYTGSLTQWLASLQGEDGDPGDPGKSAYQVARDGGYSGTETQWLASLKGTPGPSAYQVARDGGYGGTQAQWLASLKGDPGDPGASAYQVWLAAGNTGTVAQYLASLKGAKGEPGDASSGNVSSGQITDASTSGKIVLTGTPQQGRQALGAGTSDLNLGTTSTTAKRGDWTPSVADVVGLATALAGKASFADVDARVQQVVGAAPAALDTLVEIAARIEAGDDDVTALVAEVAGKVSEGDPRLTDARTPTAHDHTIADVDGLRAELDDRPTDAALQAAVTDKAELVDGRHVQAQMLGLPVYVLDEGQDPAAAGVPAGSVILRRAATETA